MRLDKLPGELGDYYFIQPSQDDAPFIHTEIHRCLADRLARHPDQRMPFLILLGGPSAVGKSSLAIELARLFGVRSVVSTDVVRIVSSSCSPDLRLLSYFSHECWQAVSADYSPPALIEGFRLQCEALLPAFEAVCQHAVHHKQNCIIEGTHLTPLIIEGLCQRVPAEIVPLILLVPEQRLRSVMIRNRARSTYMHRPESGYDDERMQRLRVFHRWWRQQAASSHIESLVNEEDPSFLVQASASRIVRRLTRGPSL